MAASIKVNRLLLITKLEESKAAKEKELAALREQYKKDLAAYDAEVTRIKKEALKLFSRKLDDVTLSEHWVRHGLRASLRDVRLPGEELPERPENPDDASWQLGRDYRNPDSRIDLQGVIEQIDAALKVLNMSTEPSVPASYYQSVVNYI